jgi:hypothetical protein
MAIPVTTTSGKPPLIVLTASPRKAKLHGPTEVRWRLNAVDRRTDVAQVNGVIDVTSFQTLCEG